MATHTEPITIGTWGRTTYRLECYDLSEERGEPYGVIDVGEWQWYVQGEEIGALCDDPNDPADEDEPPPKIDAMVRRWWAEHGLAWARRLVSESK